MITTIEKEQPLRCKRYLRWVAGHPCAVCGNTETVVAHHLIGHGRSAMGTKASDIETFPVCFLHHSMLHTWGWREWEVTFGSQLIYVNQMREKAERVGLLK